MSNILPSIPALADVELVVERVYRANITSPYGRPERETRFRDYEGLRHRERMLTCIVLTLRCSLFAVGINKFKATPSIRDLLALRCERTDQLTTVITRAWTTGDTLPVAPASHDSGPVSAFDIVTRPIRRRF